MSNVDYQRPKLVPTGLGFALIPPSPKGTGFPSGGVYDQDCAKHVLTLRVPICIQTHKSEFRSSLRCLLFGIRIAHQKVKSLAQ